MRRSRGFRTLAQTGQVHLLLRARIFMLLSRYAPRPKHCKCMHCSPRTGITTRSKDNGHRSFSLLEMTHVISSSSSLSRGVDQVSARSVITRALACSSSQTVVSRLICCAVRVCVRTNAIAYPDMYSSSMVMLMVFSPGLRLGAMFFGTSRRTWPSSGSLMQKTSWPLVSNFSLLGQAWELLSLSMRTMRIHTSWSSFRQDLRSGRSKENAIVGRTGMWTISKP
mmetsp:Transcript_57579/g.184880  ORF Transcript_57579/g.184880 Transcript_57579/m.184880 type:complete len:224 (+) Transcript_57579:379-1050(+)